MAAATLIFCSSLSFLAAAAADTATDVGRRAAILTAALTRGLRVAILGGSCTFKYHRYTFLNFSRYSNLFEGENNFEK